MDGEKMGVSLKSHRRKWSSCTVANVSNRW